GMFGGGALGFGGAIGGYLARPAVQTLDQGARLLGISALSAIPRAAGLKCDASHFPCIKAPRSQAAEAFRFLIAAASGVPGAGGKGSLLFTSAALGGGNTSCAASCGVALAQSGVRTLLVDADF